MVRSRALNPCVRRPVSDQATAKREFARDIRKSRPRRGRMPNSRKSMVLHVRPRGSLSGRRGQHCLPCLLTIACEKVQPREFLGHLS
jgi:hypothetical protein